jgi:aminoglycoside phosphotransferase (APT) family kinase protein
VVGGVTLVDPWLVSLDDGDRGRVASALLEVLARIHRAVPPGPDAVPHRDNGAELVHWGAYLDWSSGGEPVPTLVDALDWCRRHRPDDEPEPALLWGDARLENVVVGDDLAVRAVLDWDMASVGAPWHDLAWLTTLDTTMEHLFGRRLPGWPDRDTTIALYGEAAGRTVVRLDWYETLALLRSTAVMTRLGYLRRDAGEPPLLPIDDNPLLDLLRERIR